MARSARSFERSKPAKKPRPTVLVICEDTKSSKTYIEDAAVHFRVKTTVEIIHCGNTDPKGIVTEAIRRGSKYDQVFCVIDRDTHEHWEDAQALARKQPGLDVVVSYPCFEYWLILHFHSNRKPYAAEGARSPGDCCVVDLKTCPTMENYDKSGGKIFGALLNRLDAAKANARRVLADAHESGDLNPSSRLHVLIEFFETLEA